MCVCVIIETDAEREVALLDAKLHSFVPNLFMKLCVKSSIDKNKTQSCVLNYKTPLLLKFFIIMSLLF
jgi:hypothetical protein